MLTKTASKETYTFLCGGYLLHVTFEGGFGTSKQIGTAFKLVFLFFFFKILVKCFSTDLSQVLPSNILNPSLTSINKADCK